MHFLISIATFAILLGIVVIVHELGHLIIARKNGVFCEAFSFGFGPVLYSRKDKLGTEWRLSLYPIGGYVKMFGDADATSVSESIPEGYTEEDMVRMSAHRKKPWQRLLISAGGPFANFIFSIVVFFGVAVSVGVQELDNTITVNESSYAAQSGLHTGDAITKANGVEVKGFLEIAEQIKKSRGGVLTLDIQRERETKQIKIEMYEKNGQDKKPIDVIGIAPNGCKYRPVSVVEAAISAVLQTYNLAYQNIKAVCLIATRDISPKNIGGVISIFKITKTSAEAGIVSFITMVAIISAILGAINLLPIPVLDGGAILISCIEWIIGKPLNKSFVNAIFMVGLVIVVGLMLLGIWNDISNLKVFNFVRHILK